MQNQKREARKKATKKFARVPFLEIQVLRLEGRPFRRSLYEQLPMEPIFQLPSKWLGKPWAKVMSCPRGCEGGVTHLHVIWQKQTEHGPTPRLDVFGTDRESRYLEIRQMESAETGLADSLRGYVTAALSAGYQSISLDHEKDAYVVYGPWVEGREVSGWRSRLPYELDSWLYAEPDLEDWARPSLYQLVGVQPRKISMVLPMQLRKSLEAETKDWKSPNAALRATTRTVNENLKRLKQFETTHMENDERWFQAYSEMERLPEIFI